MRTSTKILIIVTILLFIPNLFLTNYLLEAIVPTVNGFEFNFTALSWVALAFQILFNVFFTILFIRFLKAQRLSNAIFFSVFPLTLVYGVFMVYVSSVVNMNDLTAESVKATLKISATENPYNSYLWAGLATLVYLVLVFLIVLFTCRPLSKVEKATSKLGDGRMKEDVIKVGGGKQFKEIENSLNKINNNIKEKNNKLKKTNLSAQKSVPKQFFKFLGKNNVAELELGNKVKKKATVLSCDLKSASTISRTLSLEENFNYINSYLKVVVPLIKRYNGFVDKFLGDGVIAVFSTSQDAVECAHTILKSIAVKNKSQKELPSIDAKISINTGDVIFGIVGEDENNLPSIVSDVVTLLSKMQEINSFIGTKILISKPTLNDLPQNFEFDYRYTGDLTLDDNSQISLFESLNYYSKSRRQKLKKYKNKFETGVRFYNEKEYQKAKETFADILHALPDDKPAFVYFNNASEKLPSKVA